MLPIIGITTNYIDQKYHYDGPQIMPLADQSIYIVPEDYSRSIEQAGGTPVLLPVTDDLRQIQNYVNLCDGFMVIGGVCDVDPRLYGEIPCELVNEAVPRNDDFDLALAKYIIEHSDKPLLGICRGAHVINIALGGTLIQDLSTMGYGEHNFNEGGKAIPRHQVAILKDSFMHRVLGETIVSVNSLHHQAVKMLAPSLRSTGTSDDGVVECFEMEGDRLVIGIQWHPEMMFDSEKQQDIFRKFICCCARGASRSSSGLNK